MLKNNFFDINDLEWDYCQTVGTSKNGRAREHDSETWYPVFNNFVMTTTAGFRVLDCAHVLNVNNFAYCLVKIEGGRWLPCIHDFTFEYFGSSLVTNCRNLIVAEDSISCEVQLDNGPWQLVTFIIEDDDNIKVKLENGTIETPTRIKQRID